MKQKIDKRVPRCNQLINPTFRALKNLGGSGNNEEILMQLIEILALPDAMHPKQNERAIRKTKALMSKRKPEQSFCYAPA